MDRKKIPLVILFVFIGAVLITSLLPKTTKPPIKTFIPSPTSIPEFLTNSCDPYPKFPEDFPCEKAVVKALDLYPGTVQKVVMVSPRLSNPDGSNTDLGTKKWVITILLNTPIDIGGKKAAYVLVKISRENGELISTYEY